MNTRCPPKCAPSANRFFSHCGLTMQPPKSYSVGGQRSSRAVYRQARRHPARLQGLTVQPPQSYSVGGQRSSGQLTGKPAGTRPDYRGRWCAVSRGHPGRPNPPSPRAMLGQLSAAAWELPSTVGCGIAWIRTRNIQELGGLLSYPYLHDPWANKLLRAQES
ncbi:UNVERIFIED_CONTAM: hypothetical protein FKN15_028162 [Acipenser sinensis]